MQPKARISVPAERHFVCYTVPLERKPAIDHISTKMSFNWNDIRNLN
ncbi:MAG: hypothetical protein IPN76_20180 [Saprospiraceae bacterium]|nr:hypothetical protein [Saprospiraceae bacterium]